MRGGRGEGQLLIYIMLLQIVHEYVNMLIIRHKNSMREKQRERERERERKKLSGVLCFLEERETGE